METARLEMTRAEARQLYEKYQAHIHFGEAIDREIARAYRLLSQGKLVIRALESVRAAGLNEDGLPKLAIIRADRKECWLRLWRNGSAQFRFRQSEYRESQIISLPERTFAPPLEIFPLATWMRTPGSRENHVDKRAIVPIVPIHLRPKHKMSNYHILWEADWRDIPRDPFLLRRLGKGDLWVVLAAWDLTEVERAALRTRA